jgi:S1-C subfamily serine protease
MQRTLVIAACTAVVGGLVGGAVGAAAGGDSTAVQSSSSIPVAARSQTALTPSAIYRRDAPGVVVITATSTKRVPPTLFTPPSTEKVSSLGSGFVIDRRGDILTNDHVVSGASGIRVGFSGGATHPATVVGADPSSDLAVVRVKAPESALHPLSFDDSSALAPGDAVYAIGNPFGLDRTLTAGIVSATGRDIQAPDGLTIPNAIQTDAAINHGNSGGPLLDANGAVVGVNSQIQGGTVDANVGVGFAIGSDTARSVAQQLIDHGSVAHPWLGVQVATIPPGVAGLPRRGVEVTKVTAGSPAARAGLRAATGQETVNGVATPIGGDAIVALDGRAITTSTQLADAVARHKPGDEVRLQVVRNGAERTITVQLGSVPESA